MPLETDVPLVFPPPVYQVAATELDALRGEREVLRALCGIDTDAPLPPAAHVGTRFKHLAKDSAYLRKAIGARSRQPRALAKKIAG